MSEISRAQLISSTRQALPFIGMKLQGSLEGLIFSAEIEQTFVNPGDTSLEVIYAFPLPYLAILLDLHVRLGDHKLRGSVIQRHQAEVEYVGAITDGNSAIMLEQHKDGHYTLNLGNLAPEETCVIRIRYAQVLSFEQRGIRLLIPMVIAPRFGNPMTEGNLNPHQIPETSLEVSYPFEFSIDIKGQLACSRISSPSHPIGVVLQTSESGDYVHVTLGASSTLDRDLILKIDELSVNSLALLGTDQENDISITSLISFCPQFIKEAPSSIAVKFLVDCSGSMAGDSIMAAKRALQFLIKNLQSRDRFSLSKFGSDVVHRSRSLWSLKDATRISAQRWIGDLEANMGGTEMEEAITSTLKISNDGPSDIFIITDGEIYGIDTLLDTARLSGQRVFAVGIGSSPSEGTIRQLAEVTGGACDFVTGGENVEPAILRMFARLRSPRVDNLEVIWPEDSKPVWQSKLPLSAFDSDTVHVFATWEKAPKGKVVLVGRLDDAPVVEIAQSKVSDNVAEETTLSRMAASYRIPALPQKKAQAMAVAYQLVTNYTNFLLIHVRAADERSEEMPELIKVQQMLPEGWGGIGSINPNDVVFSLRSTTPAMLATSSSSFCNSIFINDQDLQQPAFIRRSEPDSNEPSSIPECLKDDSPEALIIWLHNHDLWLWPTSLGDLLEFGLNTDVVIWLSHLVQEDRWAHLTEEEVIRAFLDAMAQIYPKKTKGVSLSFDPLLGLKKRLGLLNFKNQQERDRDEYANSPMVLYLEEALKGITMKSWPTPILKHHQDAVA